LSQRRSHRQRHRGIELQRDPTSKLHIHQWQPRQLWNSAADPFILIACSATISAGAGERNTVGHWFPNCVFSPQFGNDLAGGAVYNFDATPTFVACQF